MKMIQMDQKGQGLTEYITLLLLVAVCSVAVTKSLGGVIKKKIQEAEHHINSDVVIDR